MKTFGTRPSKEIPAAGFFSPLPFWTDCCLPSGRALSLRGTVSIFCFVFCAFFLNCFQQRKQHCHLRVSEKTDDPGSRFLEIPAGSRTT